MKRKYILVLAFVLVTIFGFSLFPGNPIQQKIQESLEMFSQHFYQEKVYVQLDKDSYVAGRTIWYKAYVTLERRPTPLSSILYLDLINKNGQIVQHQKRPIKEGGAFGDFELDTTLASGDYRLRAYTMWMRNFNPDFFFHKDIHIYNLKDELTAEETKMMDFSVQFFPEGGNLVDSLESTVAFKAINQDGLPMDVHGIIVNNRGEIVDSIQSIHDGMGDFTFTPKKGESYRAEMWDSTGKKKRFKLPDAQKHGVVLKVVKVDNDKIFFQVMRNFEDEAAHNNFEIAAQTQDNLTYLAQLDFEKGYIGGVIPTKDNPAGILQVTLFSEKGMPLAERLVFTKKKQAQLDLNLKMDKTSLDERVRNKYTLQVPDSIHGNFSVAVTDADQVLLSDNQDNIISNLLMNNDLKGFVYNPAWYFEKEDSATEKGLDLVMLTNGWRRFEWKKIINQEFPKIKFPPEPNGLYFIGEITDRKGPVAGGNISIMMKSPIDSSTNFMFGTAEESGLFKINNLSFEDTAYLYYKATDPKHKRKPVEVEFEEGIAPEDRLLKQEVYADKLPLSDSLRYALGLADEQNRIDQLIGNRSILLQQVEVKAKKKSKEETLEDRYASGMFKSMDGYTFDLTDQPLPYSNILDFLVGKVPGLQVRTSDPMHPSVRWRGGSPGIFLDEIPTEIDQISDVPVDDVAFIKVFRPPFMAGFGGTDGAIAIYTRRGDDVKLRPGQGLDKAAVTGYTVVKEFYSPDYSLENDQDQLPDKRATLYWNPELKTDSTTHDLDISFYNTDVTKRIRVTIEGITQNGQLVHIRKEIK